MSVCSSSSNLVLMIFIRRVYLCIGGLIFPFFKMISLSKLPGLVEGFSLDAGASDEMDLYSMGRFLYKDLEESWCILYY